MSAATARDVVVTVPMARWREWISEGALPGEPDGAELYAFTTSGGMPRCPVERCYIVAHGRVRGFAPVVDVFETGRSRVVFVRAGGAVACTIDRPVTGFRGWRFRWWDRADERPFPDWQTAGVR